MVYVILEFIPASLSETPPPSVRKLAEEGVPPVDNFTPAELRDGIGGGNHCLMRIGDTAWLVVDEDGLRRGLPPNLRATELARKAASRGIPVVGDALLIRMETSE